MESVQKRLEAVMADMPAQTLKTVEGLSESDIARFVDALREAEIERMVQESVKKRAKLEAKKEKLDADAEKVALQQEKLECELTLLSEQEDALLEMIEKRWSGESSG